MEITLITVKHTNKPYYFAYNSNGFVVKPTRQIIGSTSSIGIIGNTELVEVDTIEQLQAEINLLGLIFNCETIDDSEKLTWHVSDKNLVVRIFMQSNDYIKLLASREIYNSSFLGISMLYYFNTINPVMIEEDNGYYIYLSELFEEHKVILERFNAKIQLKPL